MKPLVEMYTWTWCPYCIHARRILEAKGVAFQEYVIDGDEEARQAMSRRANGRRTVPQIFIGGVHVGGCTDLQALEASGKLDALLAGAGEREVS